MAAKKAASSNRTDPKNNKSLAIRLTLQKLPNAKAAEIVDAVKKDYGHSVTPNVIYMVKTKENIASRDAGKSAKVKEASRATPNSATQWVEAIKLARLLVKKTGNVANATALLQAVEN